MALKINFSSITMSVIHMADMVHFYNNMLDTNLSPFEAYGTTFYRGDLAGLKIVFCPVEVSGVIADQNRHQLNFDTNNIAEIVALATKYGGHQKGEIVPANNKITVAVIDPDGNTLEFLQTLGPSLEPVITEPVVETVVVEKTVAPIIHNEIIQPIVHETVVAPEKMDKDVMETTDVPERTKPIHNNVSEKKKIQEEPVLNKKDSEPVVASNKVLADEVEKNNRHSTAEPQNMNTARQATQKNEDEQPDDDDDGSMEILTGNEDYLQKVPYKGFQSNFPENEAEAPIDNNQVDQPAEAVAQANEEPAPQVSNTDQLQVLAPHEEAKVLHISEKI